MPLNLSTRIAELATQNPSARRALNRVIFLALQDEVRQGLKDGWTIKAIWETLQTDRKLDFSYQTFRLFVNRLILKRPDQAPPTAPPAAQKNPQKTPDQPPAEIKGFKFNPVAKKEDLL